jgi:hypothetical protein
MIFFVFRLTACSRCSSSSSSKAEIIWNAVCRTFPPFSTTRLTILAWNLGMRLKIRRSIFLLSSIDSHAASRSVLSFSSASRSIQSSKCSGPLSLGFRSPETTNANILGSLSCFAPLCLFVVFLALANAFQTRNAATVARSGLYCAKIRMISQWKSWITSAISTASGSGHLRKIFNAIFSNSRSVFLTNSAYARSNKPNRLPGIGSRKNAS